MIFSLYFKTSANQRGIMYSTSHAWNYNPGVHIAMNENGTLEFQVWVLGCGVQMSTEGVYNNNQWYHVEIWYNGISANPIITIYIDDDEDTSIEHWICSFEHDEFGTNKMGRRSHNLTNYYDGALDEVKVIKFPGGNQQNPPEIDGPTTGIIGEELEFDFTTIDPEDDEIYLYIDWDNGEIEDWFGPYNSGDTVTKTITYSENGTYRIKAKSKDIWEDSTYSFHEIRIGNIAPTAPIISGPTYGEPGSVYKYTFKSRDYDDDNVWYWIDWGDGEIEEWLGGEQGITQNVTIDVYHDYENKGLYDITAKAKDIYDQESEVTTYPIRIGNEKPDTPSITGPQTCQLDQEYEYTFVATDSDDDDLIYFINWGDGHEINDLGPFTPGDPVVLKKTWHNKGTFYIKCQVQDQIGDFSEEGTLRISAPKSKGFFFSFPIMEWILNHFEYSFPILRNLLGK
jgi:hypothetical protein